jgi:SAM-dependent methyltransferase
MGVRAKWMLKFETREFIKQIKVRWRSFRAWRKFWSDFQLYNLIAPIDAQLSSKFLSPALGDDTAETTIEPIYFYQDAWAFEKIVQRMPSSHVDVGSHHKYVALLSKVVPLTMVDIRPLSLPMESIKFKEGSILDLPFEDNSIESVSSICVIEHIGLGRYGDPLDPYGTEKAIEELKRVVRDGGDLYISLPVDDKNRVYFNAHRAFEETYLEELFKPFIVVERRYIYGTQFVDTLQQGFGIGCYHLQKPGGA